MTPPIETLTDLATLVSEMRNLQRTFFRTRDGKLIERCKVLEKQVDQACEEIMNKQPRLFE
jgi:phosphate uptake regulator